MSSATPRPGPRSGGAGVTARRLLVAGAVLGGLVLLSACAASGNAVATDRADAGFWLGLWHGVITPVTFVVSLFTDDVGIYEVRNEGAWYDFGYVLGLSVIFSGGGAASRRG